MVPILRARALLGCIGLLLVAAPCASAQEPTPQPDPAAPPQANATGGAQYGADPVQLPQYTVPGAKAVLLSNGLAAAPQLAPPQVQQAIWKANEIQGKPYIYGGGHARVEDRGYDCSGTVSYALIGAGLLRRPRDSSSFLRYGSRGRGQWITVFTNPGHAYMVIAGLRLDTSAAGARGGKGPRWRGIARPMRGYAARHPVGF